VILTDAIIVVLEAAHRPLNLYELVSECQPYLDETVSHFEVKQVCVQLLELQRVRLESVDPLSFVWAAA